MIYVVISTIIRLLLLFGVKLTSSWMSPIFWLATKYKLFWEPFLRIASRLKFVSGSVYKIELILRLIKVHMQVVLQEWLRISIPGTHPDITTFRKIKEELPVEEIDLKRKYTWRYQSEEQSEPVAHSAVDMYCHHPRIFFLSRLPTSSLDGSRIFKRWNISQCFGCLVRISCNGQYLVILVK